MKFLKYIGYIVIVVIIIVAGLAGIGYNMEQKAQEYTEQDGSQFVGMIQTDKVLCKSLKGVGFVTKSIKNNEEKYDAICVPAFGEVTQGYFTEE